MSINPVAAFASNSLASNLGVAPRPASNKSDLEPRPTRESKPPQSEPVSFELPQDEVQVQRDPAGSGQIVIRYLDSKGNLILQVPSSQLLGLARSIQETLSAQAKSHAADDATEQGDTHGY